MAGRGKVIQVPIHDRDWSLFLGALVTLANGIDQSQEAGLKRAIKAALDDRQGRSGDLAFGPSVR
jgi:hypothetical protein